MYAVEAGQFPDHPGGSMKDLAQPNMSALGPYWSEKEKGELGKKIQ